VAQTVKSGLQTTSQFQEAMLSFKKGRTATTS